MTELARTLTGWAIRGARQNRPEFFFDRGVHDPGDKRILGQKVEGGGLEEGEQVIRSLARHPSTARFISTKLACRFVADDPPVALVERAAETYRRTRGDIRSVLADLVGSPEFFSEEVRGVKVKTPLEFVASAVRGVGGELRDGRGLARVVEQMGMPLYLQAPPTGYPDAAADWISADAMLKRLEFAQRLAADTVPGVSVDSAAVGERDTESLVTALVPAGLGPASRAAVEQQDGEAPVLIVGMLLGSPEFQRR